MVRFLGGIVSLLVLSTGITPVPTQAAGTVTGITGGSAFAGRLQAGVGSSLLSVGPLFPVGLGCSIKPGTATASATSMALGSVATTGTLADTVTSTRSATLVTVKSTASVQNVQLLGNLITATAVTAVANSREMATAATSSNGTSFVGLVVNGTAISGTLPPNTRIDLPGLGYVVLNQQIGPVNGTDTTSITVNAIHVYVTLSNTLGLPIGTQITIAHAASTITRTASNSTVTAGAYALFATGLVGARVTSGPWAAAGIGCTGGTSTVSLGSVSIPNVASIGTMVDTASGQVTSTGGTASASSKVQTADLLSGIVHADAVNTAADASVTNGVGSASASTSLVNATVLGIAVSANPAPNTRVNLPGIGYVVLNEQKIAISAKQASASVNGIDLYVTVAQPALGLKAGARIIVAHSNTGVESA